MSLSKAVSSNIFKDGQWATAHMREHLKVQVTISVDRAQVYGESTSVGATNVTAIADTGAQVNVWSLDEFVKYGFSHDILTPASNLVAANHSSISIAGACFAIVKELSCHGYVVQCWTMVHVSADIQTLFLSHGTLSTLGVLSPSFPSLGEHANAETQECAGEPAAITVRTVTGGCASPDDENHSCTCPQRTAVPPPPCSLPFRCIPENNDRMKTWLLERYASSTFTHVRIALFIALQDHPSKSMSASQRNRERSIPRLLFFYIRNNRSMQTFEMRP